MRLNRNRVTLQKLIMNHVPQIGRLPGHSDSGVTDALATRPYLQIFQGDKILFNSLSPTRMPEVL